MKRERVVITGGSGFIMSHVAERLVATGKDVILFDNNEQHALYEETQELLKSEKNVRFVQGDVRDRDAVDALVKDAETVYHFAALMGTSSRFKEWEIPTVEVNIIGTINVLQASLNAGVKYFVYPPGPPLPSGRLHTLSAKRHKHYSRKCIIPFMGFLLLGSTLQIATVHESALYLTRTHCGPMREGKWSPQILFPP